MEFSNSKFCLIRYGTIQLKWKTAVMLNTYNSRFRIALKLPTNFEKCVVQPPTISQSGKTIEVTTMAINLLIIFGRVNEVKAYLQLSQKQLASSQRVLASH